MHSSTSRIRRQLSIALLAAFMCLKTMSVHAQHMPIIVASKIDQAVLSALSSQYGTTSTIIAHVDLTVAFKASSQWTLVAAKEPDAGPADLFDNGGPVSLCFVKNLVPDCSEETVQKKYREYGMDTSNRPFYQLFDSKIVYATPGDKHPLLILKTCSARGGNSNCAIATFLYAYDRAANTFRLVFFNVTGKNNNQETRFIEKGPLLGSVVAVDPTSNAPYTYYVTLYQRDHSGLYRQVLRYRGKTGYDDGNRLPVIDSEMPEILQRLGRWKPGDALPVPPAMPSSCSQLFMHKGVEWCK